MRSQLRARIRSPSLYVRNILTLATGTALAQLILVAATPILTRLFTPAAIGSLALFMAIVAIGSVFVTGRFEMAIVVPKESEDARRLTTATSLLAVATSLFAFVAISGYYFLARREIFGMPFEWAALLPIALFAFSFFQIQYYWNNRAGRYRLMSRSRVFVAAVTALAQIGAGLLWPATGVLIAGYVLGLAAGCTILAYLYLRISQSTSNYRSSINDWAAILVRYRRFPAFLIPAHSMSAAAYQAPVLMLAATIGPTSAGIYAVTIRVSRAPLTLIASAIGDVFRQQASEDFRTTGSCPAVYSATLRRLAVLAIPLTVSFAIAAPLVLPWALGPQWGAAGTYTQLLTPMLICQFVASPLSNMFLIAERQGLDFAFQATLLASAILPFAIGSALGWSETSMLGAYSLMYSAAYILNIILTRRVALHG